MLHSNSAVTMPRNAWSLAISRSWASASLAFRILRIVIRIDWTDKDETYFYELAVAR